MKNIFTVKTAIGLCVVGVIGLIFWPEKQVEPDLEDVVVAIESLQDESAHESLPVSKKTVKAKSTNLPGVSESDGGVDFNPEMKERLLTISEAYEEHIQYPNFSRPIQEGELERKYMPDIPIANETPARLTDPNSPTLAIKVSKMRYFPGDSIAASAVITGLAENEVSQISASLKADGQTVGRAIVSPLSDVAHSYRMVFQSVDTSDFLPRQELTIDTVFQFKGQQYQRGTSIEYVTTVARIDQIAPASVESEYLVIPVYISTDKPGYHRIKGNLYDAQGKKALVHLRDEAPIAGSFGNLSFKAHIAALKAAGSEGPYILKDLALERLPSEPDYTTEFGSVDLGEVHVDQFSFSEYDDQPFVNEKAQRIAKELRRLGS